jgi:hypothetical protein
MGRSFGWLTGMLIVALCAVALTGWSAGDSAGGSAEQQAGSSDIAAAPMQDMEALARLADGILEEQRRLWVITVRGTDGLERFHGADASEAKVWLVAASMRLAENPAYANAVWSVNVQGVSAVQEVAGVWVYVEQAAQAKQVEAYEQVGTFSYSYTSPLFQSTLKSGDADIQLQAAAHMDTETNLWRVTLGTPAILIEY